MSRKRTTQHGTNRRQFIKKASALGAGTMTAYHFTSASAQEPETQSKNDRPHVALVGCGGRGAERLR